MSRAWAVAAAIMVLCACVADEGGALELTARFTSRPVIVQASSLLSDDCMESLAGAVSFYAARGVSISLTVVSPDATSQLGIGVGGVVAVKPGKLNPDVEAETHFVHTIGGDIYAAEVELAGCDPRAVAHDMGHTLGLVHVPYKNLMNRALDQGDWSLTAEQLDWIAD